MDRGAGILLPITSLPSKYGIGCFSKSAYDFVDWLKEAGQSYWQILPLGPTSYGDSPYQSFSTYAGNPYFISLEALIEEGVLTEEECGEADFGEKPGTIDYGKMYESRYPLLRKAYERSDVSHNPEYLRFVEENRWWLSDYALFMAVKDRFDGVPWTEWAEDIRFRWGNAMDYYRRELYFDIEFQQYLQFMFQNDGENLPVAVAGCPPDGFSATGQLWGNPLYRWDYHRQTGYQWWISRLEYSFRLCDVLRIDHFRGFDEYYSIPYGEETAVNGHWEKGPGIDLFRHMERALGWKEVIAEDLGFVTDSVRRMVQESGFPGMKVLEFAFDTRDSGSANDYLPHNYIENCVVYTGTHDNETIVGWLDSIPKEDVQAVRDYLCDQHTPKKLLYKSLISMAMRSCAKLCIIPMQDYLGFDNTCRINKPSTVGENWKWRLKGGELTDQLQKEIHEICKRYGRLNWSNEKIAEPEEDEEEEDIEGIGDVGETETV